MARHYGISGVFGPQFRRVTLTDPNRFGVLGKSAVLLRTSYGDRTSPVLRGAWVLERIMGTPPTQPPPGVSTNLDVPQGQKVTTVRARLELHRAAKSCSQCHGVIDPIGLAMENFDAIGAWRDRDATADAPIDARTVLPSGVPVNGPVELRNQLLSRPDQFALAFSQKLMMYALGRAVKPNDLKQVRALVHAAAKRLQVFRHRAGRRHKRRVSHAGVSRTQAGRRQADPGQGGRGTLGQGESSCI